MRLSNKILTGGLALAAAVYLAGFWNQHRLEARLATLVAACTQTGAKAAAVPPPPAGYTLDDPPADAADTKFDLATARPITADEVLAGSPARVEAKPWEKYKGHFVPDRLVCDPETLVTLSANGGIQKDITDAYFASRTAATDTQVAALVIAFLSAIPWLWYFLLRRVVELRNAIGGKLPPE